MMFKGYFKAISKVYDGGFKGVLRQFCFKQVSRKFQDVLREFQVCVRKVSRVFHVYFKSVPKVFQGNILFLTVCFKEPTMCC